MQSTTRTSIPIPIRNSHRICKAIISPHSTSASKRRFGMLTPFPFSFPYHHHNPSPISSSSSPFFSLLTATEDNFFSPPTFRLLDSHPAHFRIARLQPRLFAAGAPRFDLRERTSAFELQGEVPGLKHEDVEIEFVDRNTLVIRGRVKREEREETDKNIKTNGVGTSQVGVEDSKGKGKEVVGKGRSASVEDEAQAADDDKSTATTGANTPTSSSDEGTSTNKTAPTATTEQDSAESQNSKYKYWLHERLLIEEFERSFKFPSDEVDQEAVKASLKNGILNITIPKIVKSGEQQGKKRIVVEN